jgi:hypothetical protein
LLDGGSRRLLEQIDLAALRIAPGLSGSSAGRTVSGRISDESDSRGRDLE